MQQDQSRNLWHDTIDDENFFTNLMKNFKMPLVKTKVKSGADY